MATVREINAIEQLAPYRAAWRNLLAQTQGATFFQSLEWLEVYWKYYGRDERLRVLLIEEAGELTGVVPLTVIGERTRLGRLKVLTYPLHDWGTFFGPLGSDPAAALTLALGHIAATRRDWELLDFRYIASLTVGEGASLPLPVGEGRGEGLQESAPQTHAALAAAGFPARESVWHETAIIDLAEGWEAYWASRESKVRNNLRRQQKRLNDLGKVELVRYRPRGEANGQCDPRFDLYDACVDIARRSWQGSSNSGTTLSHDSVREYLRETHAAAARLGCVDVNLIYVDGTPIGFGYNYHYRGSVQGIRIGYDPAFAKAGIGNMVYLFMLQDGCQRGDHMFDMGVGTLDIKRFWWTRTARSYRYTHYPLTAPRAQLLRLKHWLCNRAPRELKSEGHVAG